MNVKITRLSEFLHRLKKESSQKTYFTWLIGAGMSVSSGIPLASDISKRIILFEYLTDGIHSQKLMNPIEGIPDEELRYDLRGLNAYFDWYEKQKEVQFEELFQKALCWLNTQEGFEEASHDNPDMYQKLFYRFFQSMTTHHHFLTAVVSRRHGVNLAHLGLAGILRDHPEWGHTVFTTNFDDLLLESIYSLNHTARIFGDLEVQKESDSPSINPTYPQIVHLHGRHTSYRLLNTSDQLAVVDPNMQKTFERHISESHLIVVGYSGWNDLVMRTLRENPHVMRGNLFWIPYQSEKNIRPEVMEFLGNLPPGKAVIVVDKENPLDADSFMLAMCQAINVAKGGFIPYRKGILDYAEKQHAFTLRQLKKHPSHDPHRSLDLALEAQQDILHGERDSASNKLNDAKQIVESAEDIREEVKGKAYIEMGSAYTMLAQYEEAIASFDSAIPIFQKQGYTDFANTHKLKIFCLKGELYYRKGDIEKALDNLKTARRIARSGETEYVGYAHRLYAEISLREGRIGVAKDCLAACEDIYQATNDTYGQALCLRTQADVLCAERNFQAAYVNYLAAKDLFGELDDYLGIANTLFRLGYMYICENKFQDAEETLHKAKEIYIEHNHQLGIANVTSALGDLFQQQGKPEEAFNMYVEADYKYSQLDALHGIELAKTEILEFEFTQLNHEDIHKRLDEITDLNNRTSSRYVHERRDQLAAKLQDEQVHIETDDQDLEENYVE